MSGEIREAIHKIKKGKVLEPGNRTREELDALEESGIDIITNVLNDIHNSGQVARDL